LEDDCKQRQRLLHREFASGAVVLVAHGFVAKVIRAILTDPSWDDFFGYSLSNGQVELYHFSEKALTPSAWLQVTVERPVD
jgi:hypothetical protein